MNSTKTALILDLDGVLITTSPWKPDIIDADNYSKFNASCIAHLNILLDFGKFDIWLSSSRRERHSLEKFNEIFKYRKIKQPIIDLLPFKKYSSENIFFRYFPLKNNSIEGLFNDFLRKTSEKI